MSCLVYVHIKHGDMKRVRLATGKIFYSRYTVEVKRPQNVRTLIPLVMLPPYTNILYIDYYGIS